MPKMVPLPSISLMPPKMTKEKVKPRPIPRPSIKEENKIGAYEVGYLLAPRLNAASRMGQAKMGFTLMTSDDETLA